MVAHGESRCKQNKPEPVSSQGSAMKALAAMILRLSDIAPGLRQSARAENAHAADGAGHRVRRRLGDRHAGHRRGRARGIAALHRAIGRAQRAGGFAARRQPGGIAAAPPLLAGTHRARRAHPHRPTSTRSKRCRRAAPCIPRGCCPSPRTTCRNCTACARPTPSFTACTWRKAASSTSTTTPPAPRSACWAKAPKSTCWATAPAVGKVRQSERHLAGSGGRAGRATDGRRANRAAAQMQDLNNIVYIPLNTFQYRFWDQPATS